MSKQPPPYIIDPQPLASSQQRDFIADVAARVAPGSASIFFQLDDGSGPRMDLIVGSQSAAQLLDVLTNAVEDLQRRKGLEGFETERVCLHLSSEVLTGSR